MNHKKTHVIVENNLFIIQPRMIKKDKFSTKIWVNIENFKTLKFFKFKKGLNRQTT